MFCAIGWKSVVKGLPISLASALGHPSEITPAMKPAHLLRLTPAPRPYPGFRKMRESSTCGFVFAKSGMVVGCGPNVVDGPVSWRAVRGGARDGAVEASSGPGTARRTRKRREAALPPPAGRAPRALSGASGPVGRPRAPPAKFFPKFSLHRRPSSRIVLLRTGA